MYSTDLLFTGRLTPGLGDAGNTAGLGDLGFRV